MDFVMGARSGPMLYDMDARGAPDEYAGPLSEVVDPRCFGLYNLHCNGGVFNLGHRHPAMLAAVGSLAFFHVVLLCMAHKVQRGVQCVRGGNAITRFCQSRWPTRWTRWTSGTTTS